MYSVTLLIEGIPESSGMTKYYEGKSVDLNIAKALADAQHAGLSEEQTLAWLTYFTDELYDDGYHNGLWSNGECL
jgi:hypothetical protein